MSAPWSKVTLLKIMTILKNPWLGPWNVMHLICLAHSPATRMPTFDNYTLLIRGKVFLMLPDKQLW